jgi:CheY-like chemotaxis protein
LVIADNDPTALDLAVLDLGLEGHDIVATAVDGEGAVAACADHRPDVLIVDYRMPPGIDGLEAARRVVAQGLAGHVILYTNYDRPHVRDGAAAAGIAFLLKGDLDVLRAVVLRGR